MKKFILFALIIICCASVYAQHSSDHPGAMYPGRFRQTLPGGRRLWTIDLHTSAPIAGEGLKDVANLTLRDTIYADTLITDSIDVHLFINAPRLLMTVDTTGLGSAPSSGTLFVEIRKQYWDNGWWDSWAGLDTVWSGAQVGDTLHKSNALWGSSDVHPWTIQIQGFCRSGAAMDTTRIPIMQLNGQ